MGGEGLGRWCLHDPAHAPCSAQENLLFHVLITKFVIHVPLYHLQEELVTKIPDSKHLMIKSYLSFTKTLLVPYNGRVSHVEMGSNRVYTMRVRGEANIRDTALVSAENSFCAVLKVFRTAEFCRILQNSAEFCRNSGFPLVLTIGASVVL
jgi:hypothetical protein